MIFFLNLNTIITKSFVGFKSELLAASTDTFWSFWKLHKLKTPLIKSLFLVFIKTIQVCKCHLKKSTFQQYFHCKNVDLVNVLMSKI